MAYLPGTLLLPDQASCRLIAAYWRLLGRLAAYWPGIGYWLLVIGLFVGCWFIGYWLSAWPGLVWSHIAAYWPGLYARGPGHTDSAGSPGGVWVGRGAGRACQGDVHHGQSGGGRASSLPLPPAPAWGRPPRPRPAPSAPQHRARQAPARQVPYAPTF